MSRPVPDGLVRLQMHLNLAVKYGVLFGVMLGLVQLLTAGGGDPVAAVPSGVTGGLLAGILVSVLVGFRQWQAAVGARDRRLTEDPTASPTVDTGVRFERTVQAPLSRAEILRRAPDVAEAVGKARVHAVDEAAGTVTLSTGTSGWSWGEHVGLTVGREHDGQTAVTVASKPRMWGAFTDGGVNARNVERVTTWLCEPGQA